MGRSGSPDGLQPLEYERGFWNQGVSRVAGVDEVGRGPLAGPVVAAAVVLPEGVSIPGVQDSKKLTPDERTSLSLEILNVALDVGVGAASVREIDQANILHATSRAMDRALGNLSRIPGHVVVDGRPVPGLPWEHEAVVKGDAIIHCIACASIVAKVCRDRLMKRLAPRYPGYGWARNVGYGTAQHLQALRELGPTPHHRMTFGGVQLDLGLEGEGGQGRGAAGRGDEA